MDFNKNARAYASTGLIDRLNFANVLVREADSMNNQPQKINR